MYILDSCLCIELMRGHLPKTMQMMRQSRPELFGLPFIVEAELLTGAEKSSNPQKFRLLTEEFLQPFPRVAFDSNCARAYADISAALERTGKKIGPNDLIIAATAVANNAVLLSGNVNEFKRVPGLKLENWEEIEF